jgi:hypothetical protein
VRVFIAASFRRARVPQKEEGSGVCLFCSGYIYSVITALCAVVPIFPLAIVAWLGVLCLEYYKGIIKVKLLGKKGKSIRFISSDVENLILNFSHPF